MIDSHCHLADAQFDPDRDEVLLRAEEAGIDAMICIADTLEVGKKCIELAEKHEHAYHSGCGAPQIFCTIGVHPHAADEWQEESGKSLRVMLNQSPTVVALGEIGLDYHYDHAPRDVQQHAFEQQLIIAKDLDLPLVIHNRDSIDDMLKIVFRIEPQHAVMHCCTEPWENVSDWVEKGYLLSFTGIATYPKSDEIRDCIRHCPIEQMMIETDAPYLAPVPHRGKRNEPAFVTEVAKCIADVKGISLHEVDEMTSRNAVEFFRIHTSAPVG